MHRKTTHNISGIDSTVEGSMFNFSDDFTGMDILDSRDGTDTWMDRYIKQIEASANAILTLAEEN
jgi:hypothetical protein